MAVDYFLKIDGIDGESDDDSHTDEIQLASFSWSEQNFGSFSQGVGGGSGKVQLGDFQFTMRANKASPSLMLACATGKHIDSVILTCRKAGGDQEDYYVMTMTDVIVSSYATSSAGGGGGGNDGYDGGTIYDNCGLNFAQIEMSYSPQKDDGSLDSAVKVGYNCQTNTTV